MPLAAIGDEASTRSQNASSYARGIVVELHGILVIRRVGKDELRRGVGNLIRELAEIAVLNAVRQRHYYWPLKIGLALVFLLLARCASCQLFDSISNSLVAHAEKDADLPQAPAVDCQLFDSFFVLASRQSCIPTERIMQ
jgi:hypothetical protein